MSRPLLFIAHGFPPASGSGPNRALAFARYLPEHDWQPIVLTTGAAWAANPDPSTHIPPGVRVVRTRSLERPPGRPPLAQPVDTVSAASTGSASLGRRLKSHAAHALRFPDAQVGWLPFAVAGGFRAIRQRQVQVIYSTAAPFTGHLVGLILHRMTRLPWVAELRDGWYRWNQAIFPDYPFWRHPLESRLEGAAVRGAQKLILVTDAMADAFRRQYSDLAPGHFAVVPNGYDPRLQDEPLPDAQVDSKSFVVLHTGALYHGRGIEAFLDAAGRLALENAQFRERFTLRLAGTLDEGARGEIARQISHYGAALRVTYDGYLDHRAILAAQRDASLLLLIVNTTPGAEATVPGKLFEYLVARRPVLAIVPPDATAADIIRRARAGWVAPAHDVPSIQAHLAEAFAAVLENAPFEPDAEEVARYDRRSLTAHLARILDDAVGTGHNR